MGKWEEASFLRRPESVGASFKRGWESGGGQAYYQS